MASNRYKPSAFECALLFLLMIQARDELSGKTTTRCRLPRATMRKLWNRMLLPEAFLAEVADWLAEAGWAIVNTGSIFGVVRVDSVKNWPRVSSTNIADKLVEVKKGAFNFAQLEGLLDTEISSDQNEED